MNLQDVLEELNTKPEEYYNSLTNEGHLDPGDYGVYYIVENIGDPVGTLRPDETDPSSSGGAMYFGGTWYQSV